MPVIAASVPAMLRERANLAPNDLAFTFVDYSSDPAGMTESMTWSQTYRRSLNVAGALQDCGSEGDRVVVLAQQGLDYVAGFLGALQAGRIAVPLSLPFTPHDEHVRAVMRDAAPCALLTTTTVAASVAEYASGETTDGRAPPVIEIDSLDLDRPPEHHGGAEVATAYLQYTSGSTRRPAGVVVSHANLVANFEQVMATYFADYGRVAPPDTTVVSWVPLSHNMGLFIGVCAPILAGLHTVLTSPLAFIERPARWMQLLASHPRTFSPAPNFALEMAAQATTDDDMAGLDLGDVLHIICGGERVQAATVRRFAARFARFNLSDTVIRPSYGLAEATVYVATRSPDESPQVVHFGYEKLSAGHAERCADRGAALLSYGGGQSPAVRIVDPDTCTECPAGTVGEIWVHGDNVARGYWQNPEETRRTFGGRLVDPSPGTPEEPWLRTGDLGFISEGELFITGRIKDVVIVYGRNHYPDDIEATVRELTGGRAAAIAVPDDRTEKLVVIAEVDGADDLDTIRNDVTSAVSTAHSLGVADLVLVAPGVIPSTTSGKIRRSACVEVYRGDGFARLDD